MSKPYIQEHNAIVEVLNQYNGVGNAPINTNDISGFCFTDFFNLLKVEGKWAVVNKLYHTHSAD